MSEIKRLLELTHKIFGNYISGDGLEIMNLVTNCCNEHDALVAEVEAYKEKEKICTSCEQHPSWQIRAEKAEAEELKLRAFITTMLHHAEQDERLGTVNVKFSNELYNDLKIKFSMKKDGEG